MNMTTKSCSTCEFWDRENAESFVDYAVASCLYAIPKIPISAIFSGRKSQMADCQGQDCPVYKQIKE